MYCLTVEEDSVFHVKISDFFFIFLVRTAWLAVSLRFVILNDMELKYFSNASHLLR